MKRGEGCEAGTGGASPSRRSERGLCPATAPHAVATVDGGKKEEEMKEETRRRRWGQRGENEKRRQRRRAKIVWRNGGRERRGTKGMKATFLGVQSRARVEQGCGQPRGRRERERRKGRRREELGERASETRRTEKGERSGERGDGDVWTGASGRPGGATPGKGCVERRRLRIGAHETSNGDRQIGKRS